MEINGREDRKTIEKINRTKISFFENSQQNWQPLAGVDREKETIQSTKIIHERVDVPDLTEIMKVLKSWCEQFCVSEL